MKILMRYLGLAILGLCLAPNLFSQEEVDEGTYNEDAYYDGIVRSSSTEEGIVLPYDHLREADVPWQVRVWRVIDTREKINHTFSNPDVPLFNIMREHLENGDFYAFRDEGFKEQLTAEDIASSLNRIDTVPFFNEETYEEEIKIVPSPVNPEDIKRYRLKEIWYFNKKTSELGVRILGIAPIKDKFSEETGEFLYAEPLFWVYFPEAREYLAKHRVINDFNDGTTMTWNDLFEDRFFSSYITKKSNALGLRLQDKYPDDQISALMESERLKNELFNFEHDLWEY